MRYLREHTSHGSVRAHTPSVHSKHTDYDDVDPKTLIPWLRVYYFIIAPASCRCARRIGDGRKRVRERESEKGEGGIREDKKFVTRRAKIELQKRRTIGTK